MVIELSTLIYKTRLELSDIPEDHASDEIIFQSLSQAVAYVAKIVNIPDVEDSYLSFCYMFLAAYYTYLNYTALVERQMGEVPSINYTRLDELKNKARVFLNQVSDFTIDSNLNISAATLFTTPTSTGLVTSVDD